MSVKEILADYGMTMYQAIIATNLVIGFVGFLFKIVKKPFELLGLISRNKFVLLSIDEKSDAINTIYEKNDDSTKSSIYTRKIKLAHYGLRYPTHTLQVAFDYLHSIEKLTTPLYINDFLKHYNIFTNRENSLPVVSLKSILSSLGVMAFFSLLSIFGFIIGINELREVLQSKSGWEFASELSLLSVSELFFLQ